MGRDNTMVMDRRRASNETVSAVLDYALGNPQLSFKTITKRFKLGGGTLNYWLKPIIRGKDPKSMTIHPEVLRWMKEHGPEWFEARPRNTLGPAVLKVAKKAIKSKDSEESKIEKAREYFASLHSSTEDVDSTEEPKSEEVFQPKTSGDLVVLETEVEDMLRRAVATVHHLESVLTSIKITVEWTREVDGRLTAEKKVRELENQVSLADKAAKEAQTQMLSNKMIEKFGSR